MKSQFTLFLHLQTSFIHLHQNWSARYWIRLHISCNKPLTFRETLVVETQHFTLLSKCYLVIVKDHYLYYQVSWWFESIMASTSIIVQEIIHDLTGNKIDHKIGNKILLINSWLNFDLFILPSTLKIPLLWKNRSSFWVLLDTFTSAIPWQQCLHFVC